MPAQIQNTCSDLSLGHFHLLVICCQSFRHGSRAGQEDNRLVCQYGQVVNHIKNDDHIVIRRRRRKRNGSNGTIISKKELKSTCSHMIINSRLSFPATEPPDPRRVSEGFQKGSLKGSLKGVSEGFSKGFRRVLG